MSDCQIKSAPQRNTIHWGNHSNFERFVGAYFIEVSLNTAIKKHVITKVKYEPDEIYNRVDGMAGCCWAVGVLDTNTNTTTNYHIRNWIDIVHHYEEQGYQFVSDT
jgi:hypothetical protein